MRKTKNKSFLLIVIFLGASVLIYLALNIVSPSIRSSENFVQFCDANNSCHETGLPYQNPSLSVDARVDDLLGRMTLAEKIGQMALIEKNSIHDPNDIAKYG